MEVYEQIQRYKRSHHAVIAAHTYQDAAVQDVADMVGDSFALAQKAAATDAATVILCGVRFLAEGVKILAPEKRVILAEPEADCPMARQIPPERVAAFKAAHPDWAVVAYINTTAELKAVSDVCVTSSSAVKIVTRLPQQHILFIPDQNLGDYVRRMVPDKEIVTWDGYCPVHHAVSAADIAAARQQWPQAKVAIHPECVPDAVAAADMVGSTADIIRYIDSTTDDIIVVTERGVVDRLAPRYPGRLHQLRPDLLTCRDMKRTTMESLAAVIEGRGGEEIQMDEALMAAARHSLETMIELGR